MRNNLNKTAKMHQQVSHCV